MEGITIYNGMGEPIKTVYGTVLFRQSVDDAWDIVNIATEKGTLMNQYVKSGKSSLMAAE